MCTLVKSEWPIATIDYFAYIGDKLAEITWYMGLWMEKDRRCTYLMSTAIWPLLNAKLVSKYKHFFYVLKEQFSSPSILLTTDTEDFQLWARITVYFWPWHIYETSNFASNWPHYHKWITFFFIQLLLIVGVVDCFAAIYVNTQLIGLFVSSWKIADNYLKRFMTPHVFNSRTICQHSAKKAALSL